MDRKLSDILKNKGSKTLTISPDRTLRAAARALCEARIGALPVIANKTLLGILSERDLLRCVAEEVDLDQVQVDAAMTRKVIVGVEDDLLGATMHVMTTARIRHLPVMRGDELVGIISIGDIVNMIKDDEQKEVRYLTDYIKGTY